MTVHGAFDVGMHNKRLTLSAVKGGRHLERLERLEPRPEPRLEPRPEPRLELRPELRPEPRQASAKPKEAARETLWARRPVAAACLAALLA